MIFVTVGSTYFNELIEEVDRLVAEGVFDQQVVCQIGSGEFEPSHCEYFRYTNDFEAYLGQCSLLITHGGMTVLEGLWRGKRLIAVSNSSIKGNHQEVFLTCLADRFGVVWTKYPKEIGSLLPLASSQEFQFKEPHIAEFLKEVV